MTDRELMQMALDALANFDLGVRLKVIPALRVRLAQPEQEPVAWMYNGNLHEFDPSDWAVNEVTPLYAAPPQREWQGLMDEDVKSIVFVERSWADAVRKVEAKLKEKNAPDL